MTELASNKKAFFDYEILEKFEAGLALTGQEVKSIRRGNINLKGSLVAIRINAKTHCPQAYLTGVYIAPYKPAGPLPHYDPARPRRLLLHRQEINYLLGKKQVRGLTIVPISVYTKYKLIKAELALVRGRKKYDKRELIKKRDIERQIKSTLKQRG